MKKLFFAALIALAGFTACGTKNVETAATEATEQREVGGGDIAYVQVEAVLAQSDLYNAEGIALKDKTEKAQKSWAQKEQNFQYEVAQLQEKYQKGLITTNDAQSTQENIERRIASYQAAAQKEAKALDEENFVFSNRAQDLLHRASAFFGGGHDVVIARRHFVDGAADTSQLASSGTLTPLEHSWYMRLTVDAMRDLYEQNRYAKYVQVFQNWLKPAGASFDHLHKQLVAIDERSVNARLEAPKVRDNPNYYNEAAVDYAGYQNLVIAENRNAVAFAGFGHRYPALEIWSRSSAVQPWQHTPEELRDMSDLIHAMHAATGPLIPTNEEWYTQPIDLDVPMPWRVHLKWRVSTLAGFEGGTKIYVNTIDPWTLRDKVVPRLLELRAEGKVSQNINIATECSCKVNSLKYNRALQ